MARKPNQIIIETDDQAVVLRQFLPGHAFKLFSLIDQNRPHLNQFEEGIAYKYGSLQAMMSSILHPKNPRRFRFSIWVNRDIVGSINYTLSEKGDTATIGYWLGAEYCGHGYATIATKAVVAHLRNLKSVRWISATTHPENHGSQRVLARAGFTLVTADAEGFSFILHI